MKVVVGTPIGGIGVIRVRHDGTLMFYILWFLNT